MRVAAALVIAIAGCAPGAEDAPAAVDDRAGYEHGHELVKQYQCGQCHLEDASQTCSGCHRRITRGAEAGVPTFVGEEEFGVTQLERWRQDLVNMRELPTLHAVGKLMRSDWIEGFLLEPHDLRPRLGATMPRLAISPEEAHDMAAYLAAVETSAPYFRDERLGAWWDPYPPLGPGDREHGGALFEAQGCGVCHRFTGARSQPPWAVGGNVSRALMLAPDLRYTRDRFRREVLVPWLLEPTHFKADAAMPRFGLDYGDARDVAAYVMTEPLEPLAQRAAPPRLPPLDRPVGFQEVYQKVFAKICIHCHGQPSLAFDDGGPGLRGGFGFPAVELSFVGYEQMLAGYVTLDGKRRSVFAPDADGTPHLVAVLLARQHEEAGDRGELRGMPLGLPALQPEQVQLIETWVAGGHPY
jgi:mono/diheme cytochrome c family protein